MLRGIMALRKTSEEIAKVKGELNLEHTVRSIAQIEAHLTQIVDKTLKTLQEMVTKMESQGTDEDTLKTLAIAVKCIVDIQTNYDKQKTDLDAIKQFVLGIQNAFNEGKLAGSIENLVAMVEASQNAKYQMDIERDEEKLPKTIMVTKIVNK